eukprot:s95_g32.t1
MLLCPGNSGNAAVVHTTAYDGMVERACLRLKIPVLSVTDQQIQHTFACQSISAKLLADWKSQTGDIGQQVPRYVADPPQDSIPTVETPVLKICEVTADGHLDVPQQVKTQYATCPIRAGEWRKLLAEFNRKWGPADPSTSASATPVRSAAAGAVVAAETSGNQHGDQPSAAEQMDWESIFSTEPTTREAFEQKYQAACTFAVTNEVSGIITEGPKLFLMATADAQLDLSEPILCCGAGTWLLDGKATAFEEERGHECCRPSGVCQGSEEEDRFDVRIKDGTLMLWKAAAVQLRNVKARNAGSYFPASQILESDALKQAWLRVWRIRVYETEKVIGAAKPLIFLSKSLTLYKDKTTPSPKRHRLRRLQNFEMVPAATKSKAAPKRDDQITPKRVLFASSPHSNASQASTLILPGLGEDEEPMEGDLDLEDDKPLNTVDTQEKQGASMVSQEKPIPDTTQPLDTVDTQEKQKASMKPIPDTAQPLDTVKTQEKQGASMVSQEKPVPDIGEPLDTVNTQEKQKASMVSSQEKPIPDTAQPLDEVKMDEKHEGKTEDQPSPDITQNKPRPRHTKKPRGGRVVRPKASAKSSSSKAKKKPANRVMKNTRKKQTEAERKAVHRAACGRWHAKWVSKGVPRSEAESSKDPKKDKKQTENLPKPTTSKTAENKKDTRSKPVDKKTEGNKKETNPMTSHPKEIKDALTQDGMANLTLTSNDLRTTKAAWVNKYIAILTDKENAAVAAGQAGELLTNSEKYKKAVAAWMTSYLRGVLNSGKDKGFASIPASMLAVGSSVAAPAAAAANRAAAREGSASEGEHPNPIPDKCWSCVQVLVKVNIPPHAQVPVKVNIPPHPNPIPDPDVCWPLRSNISVSNEQEKELKVQGIPMIVPVSPVALGETQARSLEEKGMTLTDFIFLRSEDAATPPLPEDVSNFIRKAKSEARKVILMTFSSMPVGYQRILKIAVKICHDCRIEGLRPVVIAMVKGQPQEQSQQQNLIQEADRWKQKQRLLVVDKSLDFGALFPQVDAIMLHGGLGVTSEALLVT